MLRQRLVSAIVLIPSLVLVVAAGGWIYNLVVMAFFVLSGWEYARITRTLNIAAEPRLLITGLVFIVLASSSGWPWVGAVLAVGAVVITLWYVLAHERGNDNASLQWMATLAGLAYLGILGGHFIPLRQLTDGRWWVMVVVPAIAAADSAAYFIGGRFGRTPFSPRTSPKKTWEGYIGGILGGVAMGALLTYIWQQFGQTEGTVTLLNGLILSLLVATFGPIGDLGISLLKREAHLKDTGAVFAGMGGMLDRIDSWLVAVAISYYYLQLFVLQ
mgnify:CR=1 FL=1